jgi:hypothetical protein
MCIEIPPAVWTQPDQEPHHVVRAHRLRRRHVGTGQEVTGPKPLEPALGTIPADGFLGDGGLAARATFLRLKLRQWLGHRGPSRREQYRPYHSKTGIGRAAAMSRFDWRNSICHGR